MVYKYLSHLLSRGLARCVLCAAGPAEPDGVCEPCRGELPYLHSACHRCALPLPQPAGACANCLQQPPPFASARAAWHYAFPVGQLIQRFKYHRDLAAGHSLALLAADHIRPNERPDLLVPIPLHWRRYLTRGYNQAQLLASEFGRQWNIPVKPRLLHKHTATGTQQQLKRGQRLRNLRDSFRVRGTPVGLHIGLVDDVITTGATLEAAARCLLEVGAARVSTFALARTP
ncbi:ComF family protein [Microbulbifer rhizosphaerae]|uniref:ComF family protein n=1 Tax=Microbulbifer rhizosphaerae TaxID=1562603 RepID=A0A7W4WE79_9GAMM|nr:ComF family protein [Microbulbifer rhizosphaerae]MBB3062629.1 ComF family protein [Microbulbifer rhizosphaerae]